MATFRTVELTGTDYLDTLYAGKAWTANAISYSFPQTLADLGDTSDYVLRGLWAAGTDAAAAFEAAGDALQQAVAAALRIYASFTNLTFTEAGQDGAGDIRLYSFQAPENITARVVALPGQTGGAPDGDVELGRALRDGVGDPGQYSWFTLLHELGHALGLKHPHDIAPLDGGGPADGAPGYDSIEYTIMSYRSYVGAPLGGYTAPEGSFPAMPMMNDIAALQHLYGANYTTNSGDTVYTFDPGAATIFRTVWDGGGTDTYNFSNYRNGLSIDLRPGHWVNLNTQLVKLDLNVTATGNIANAWMHDDDTRSLIENAVGGSGNDLLVGNDIANVLTGGLGNDTFAGGGGNDVFVCDAPGADFIGDFALGDAIRVGHAIGAFGAGDGIDVAARSVEYVTEFGTTTLYIDLDGVKGADLTVQFYGDGARLDVAGSDLVYAGPPQLDAPVLADGNDSGYTADATPAISGSGAVPGAAIELRASGVVVGTTTADGDGAWSIASDRLEDGIYEFTVTQTVGGRASDASLALVLTVDTVAPTVTVTGFALSDDSGISATDHITNVAAQTVTLTLGETLADGDVVQGSLDGTHWVDLNDKIDGTTLTWDGVTLGTGPLRIRVVDLAGNSGATMNLDYVLDTAAPTDIRLAGGAVYAGSAAGTAAGRLSATDPRSGDTFTYALVDSGDGRSADNAGFTIAAGVLQAVDASDWTPGTKAIYVRVTDAAGNTFDKALTVRVVEPPPPEPPPQTTTTTEIVGGVPVKQAITVYADGSSTRTLTVPVIDGDAGGVDIPVARDSAGTSLLAAHVPLGYGLVVSGAVAPQAAGVAAGTLAELLQQHGGSGIDGGATTHVGALAGTTLLVQAVTPTVMAAASGTLALTGTGGAGQLALVIDGRGLPAGTRITLDNVQVAALVGDVTVTGGVGSQHVWGDGGAQTIVLGEGDDELHGGAGNDVVGSAGGNDRIYGDAGDDTVFGGAGNDTIDGGSGHDVLALDGSGRSDYSLRWVEGGFVVAQRGAAADAAGVDRVTNVEALRFAAGDSSAEGTLARLYEALFHRVADPLGLEHWVAANAAGMGLPAIAAAFLASPEGVAAQGGLSDEAFVAGLYRQALGRAGSDAEVGAWTQVLASGASDRAGVALGFVNSAEKLAQGSVLDLEHSDVAAIARLYDMVLGRAADGDGLNFWIAAGEGGRALSSIATAFVYSGEGAALYGATTDSAYVAQLYTTGLHRDASVAELAQWTALLGSGTYDRGDVALLLSESTEHVTLVGGLGTLLPPG